MDVKIQKAQKVATRIDIQRPAPRQHHPSVKNHRERFESNNRKITHHAQYETLFLGY